MKKAKRLVLYHFFTWCRAGMIGSAIFLLPGSLYEKTGNSLFTIHFCFGSCRILLQQNGAAWLSKNLAVLKNLRSFFHLVSRGSHNYNGDCCLLDIEVIFPSAFRCFGNIYYFNNYIC